MNLSILFTNNQVVTLNFDDQEKANSAYKSVLVNIEIALKKKRYISLDVGGNKYSYNPDSILCVMLQEKKQESLKENEEPQVI